MKKILSLFVALALACSIGVAAQIVTTSPSPLQENSADIVLYYHADSPMGNNGLKNYTGDVYAHIGVTTAAGKWQFAPTWGDNAAKYKLTRIDANTYSLNIGDLHTYFGVPAATKITELCMVFRSADKSKEGKTSSGGDIFVAVAEAGLALNFDCSLPGVITSAQKATLTASASIDADIEISVNGTTLKQQNNCRTLTAEYSINAAGTYEFKATATAGGKTVEQTSTVALIGASAQRDYPGGVPVQGAVDNADGTVTFCLAAPDKTGVTIVPSWSDYKVLSENTMYYQDYNGRRYFWLTSPKLDSGKDYIYYYLVDGTAKVGDPYARLVLDPFNDKYLLDSGLGYEEMPTYPTQVTDNVMLAVWRRDMNKYNWSAFEIPQHDRLYIYEMLLRDFTGTEGQANANGTLAQAMEKIPYLKSLGINAVELMPIMEFNGNNSWGYNTNFYMAPDKAYGSPEQYKDFIDECHRNGIAVILDIVFNQTDGYAPWYQMYPIASNPFYNRYAPHDYSVLNDLNPDYDLVEQHYKDVVKYWLTEYNVDGFRFDLVKGIGDNDSYSRGTDSYNQSRVDRMKRIHAAMKEVKPDAIHINELLGATEEENANAEDGQLGWHNLNYNAAQFAMYYDEGGKGISDFYASNAGRNAWHSVGYAESHDEERVAYKAKTYGVNEVKTGTVRARRLASLGAWMLLNPGPKMIWQFQEMGNEQTTKTESGNDTSPKRVSWNDLNNAIKKHIVAAYQAAGQLRAENEDMFGADGSFTSTWSASLTAPRSLCVRKGGKTIVGFFNPSTTAAQDVTVSGSGLDAANAELIYACEGFSNPSLSGSGGTLKLNVPANSFAIYATAGIYGGIGDAVVDGDEGFGCNVSISGSYGEIIVEGAEDNVEAFDMSGRRVALTGLPAGIYVVRAGSQAVKVAVK